MLPPTKLCGTKMKFDILQINTKGEPFAGGIKWDAMWQGCGIAFRSVKLDGKWGFIDKNGTILWNGLVWDGIYDHTDYGNEYIICYVRKNGVKYTIDNNGIVKIQKSYSDY